MNRKPEYSWVCVHVNCPFTYCVCSTDTLLRPWWKNRDRVLPWRPCSETVATAIRRKAELKRLLGRPWSEWESAAWCRLVVWGCGGAGKTSAKWLEGLNGEPLCLLHPVSMEQFKLTAPHLPFLRSTRRRLPWTESGPKSRKLLTSSQQKDVTWRHLYLVNSQKQNAEKEAISQRRQLNMFCIANETHIWPFRGKLSWFSHIRGFW